MQVECRYTGFVDYRSRATWPRFNLRALASTLNTRDAAVTSRGSHLRWDVSGYTDPGPVLRLDDTRPGEKLRGRSGTGARTSVGSTSAL